MTEQRNIKGAAGNAFAQALASESEAFIEGFLEKCASQGVDPMALIKAAGIFGRYRAIGREVGPLDANASGLSRIRERLKRLRIAALYSPKGGFFTGANDWKLRMNELKNQQTKNQQYWKGQLNPTPSYYEKWKQRYEDADPFRKPPTTSAPQASPQGVTFPK